MKRLDKNQRIVLTTLAASDGSWKVGGWTFGTNHRTENILVGLTQIGLAERTGTHRDFGKFKLTPRGLELARSF